MDVGYHLTSIRALVKDEAVPVLSDVLLLCHLTGHHEHFAQGSCLLRILRGQVGDVTQWDDEEMDWRLGVYVPDDEDVVVLVEYLALYAASGHLAKDAVLFCHCDLHLAFKD